MRGDDDIARITTAAQVQAKAEALYGSDLAATGVVHVTAVTRRRGAYETLKIGPETPESNHDFFVLNLTRARADAILTTGKNLRAEPELVHRLQGPGQVSRALLKWRERYLKKSRPPVTLVLTSGRDVDLEHPVFHSWTRPVIFTGRDGQWRLESRAPDRGVEIVGVDEPGVRAAIECLRFEFGAATIAIEAGPSVSRRLYQEPAAVDELLLSVADVPVPDGVRGDVLLSAEDLGRLFPPPRPAYRVETGDGTWSFYRFRR